MTARTFTEAQVERGLLEMGRLAYADAVDRANGIGPMEPLHDTATRILSGMEAVEPLTVDAALAAFDEVAAQPNRATARALFEVALRGWLSLPATREVPGEAVDAVAVYDDRAAWSREAFGEGDRYKGVVEHIRRELKEIEKEPSSLEEWCDVVMLAMDGAWRSAGADGVAFWRAFAAKMAVNRVREWAKPDADGVVEHVRAAPSTSPGTGGGSDIDDALREAYREGHADGSGSDQEGETRPIKYQPKAVSLRIRSKLSPTPTPMRVAEAVRAKALEECGCCGTVRDCENNIAALDLPAILKALGSPTSAREPYGHLPITGPLTLYEALREAIAIGRQAERTTGPALDEDGYARKLAAAVGSPTDEGASEEDVLRSAAAEMEENWAEITCNRDTARAFANWLRGDGAYPQRSARVRAKALRSPARGK